MEWDPRSFKLGKSYHSYFFKFHIILIIIYPIHIHIQFIIIPDFDSITIQTSLLNTAINIAHLFFKFKT